MEFCVLQMVVTKKDTATIHQEYDVEPAGVGEEMADAPVTGMRLPKGGYLLHINDKIAPDNDVFAKLSQEASLVACYVNETVMQSYTTSWKNGVLKWSVFHDAQQGLEHIEACGDFPNQLEKIANRLYAKQGDRVDIDCIFEIPIELFVACGGIRYDQDLTAVAADSPEVLRRVREAPQA